MAEYIEKNRLILCLNDWMLQTAPVKAGDDATRADTILDAIKMVEDIPAADVRPVVLCRDCKNWFMTPNGRKCYYAEWGIEDDDFCSCGEKREES